MLDCGEHGRGEEGGGTGVQEEIGVAELGDVMGFRAAAMKKLV